MMEIFQLIYSKRNCLKEKKSNILIQKKSMKKVHNREKKTTQMKWKQKDKKWLKKVQIN